MTTSSTGSSKCQQHHSHSFVVPDPLGPLAGFAISSAPPPSFASSLSSSSSGASHHQEVGVVESSSSSSPSAVSALPQRTKQSHHPPHQQLAQQKQHHQNPAAAVGVSPVLQPLQLPPASVVQSSVLETPSGQPALGLPGYAAVRDDDDLDIYALFFSPGGAAGTTTSSDDEMTMNAPEQNPMQLPQQPSQPPQPAGQPMPPPQPQPPIAPSVPLSAPMMMFPPMMMTAQQQGQMMMPPTMPMSSPPPIMPSMVTPELPSPLARPRQQLLAATVPAPPQQQAHASALPLPPSPHLSGGGAPAATDIAAMARRNFVSKEEAERNGMSQSSSINIGGSATTAKRSSSSSGSGGPLKKRSCLSSTSGGGSRRTAIKTTRTATASSSSSSSSTSQEGSPHSFLLTLLRTRGYATSIHKSAECGYKSSATPLQLASYGTAVLRASQTDDGPALSVLLRSGLSPNPCNRFSESILDMSAKRGSAEAFAVQMNAGADVQTADDFGRTPLHHAAWGSSSGSSSKCFDIVDGILSVDPDMVRVADDRGRTPLEYVRPSEWGRWIEFLRANQDRFWPKSRATIQSPEESVPRPKRGTGADVSDPRDALPVEVAKLVADGKVKPEDARSIRPDSPILAAAAARGASVQRQQVPGAFKFPSMLTAAQAGGRVSGGGGGNMFSRVAAVNNNNKGGSS